METKDYFKANLHRLLALAGLGEEQFVDQFIKASDTKLRPRAIREWLDGTRVAYKANLDQLAAFWRTRVPQLDPPHLMLPPAEFEKVLARSSTSEPALGGVTLDIDPAQISEEQITGICGSYRIFRYDSLGTRIVSEALSINRRLEGNKSVLDAALWSPTTRMPQEFSGKVIVLGNNVYMVLHDVDAASPMMRFLNLSMSFGKLDAIEFGMMSGTFDASGASNAMGVAVEKMSLDPSAARQAAKRLPGSEGSWVLPNATSAIDPTVLLALQRPVNPKAY